MRLFLFEIGFEKAIPSAFMRSDRTDDFLKRVADAWLTVSVHFDAFCASPKAYLTATKWWIKRRRVRARGQFAPLLGRSPRAYMLWALRQERMVRDRHVLPTRPFIWALIDARGDYDKKAMDVTLQSLSAQSVPALLVGAAAPSDLRAAIAGMDWTCDPWILPIRPGDRIAHGAVEAYRQAIAAAGDGPSIFYADDDNQRGRRRHMPYFKPDWNAELFAHHDYLTGACIIRATRGQMDAVADATDWAEQLVRQMAGQGRGGPVHVRQMLHHRHQRPAPHIPVALLDRSQALPPLTVIVPTRNHVDLLKTCLEGVAAADYPDVDVIVMDNDSDDPETLAYLASLDPTCHRVLRHAGRFNYSAINNRAAGEARGRLLCLLNNDIEMMDRRWLATLAVQATRTEVGAVGARLLYPDGRIQHAGVVIGVGNAAGHAHRFLHSDEQGYFHRHNLPQYVTAVTAACLVVEREKFLAVGGLNEQDFAVAFNDVDLCLRLNQKGWQSFYEPRATLIHHESVSRGLDQDPVGAARFAGELAALKRLWRTDEIVDPYHHPQLSRASEQFAVAI